MTSTCRRINLIYPDQLLQTDRDHHVARVKDSASRQPSKWTKLWTSTGVESNGRQNVSNILALRLVYRDV